MGGQAVANAVTLNEAKTIATVTIAAIAGDVAITATAYKTYSVTFYSSQTSTSNDAQWTTSGQTISYGGASWTGSWTSQKTGSDVAVMNASQTSAQIGAKAKPAATVTLTSSSFGGKKIRKIALDCFCMSNTGPALTAVVGTETVIDGEELTKTTSTVMPSEDYLNIQLAQNGTITFTINSSVGAAICITGLTVIYS